MKATIPPALEPYLQECVKSPALTLLTSVLDTPANWLLTRFLVSGLQDQSHVSSRIVLVSLWRPFDLWHDLSQKLGVNLKNAIASSRLCYVDGLATSTLGPGPGYITLNGTTIKELQSTLISAVQPPSEIKEPRTTVLIDGLDLFLAMQQSPSTTELQRVLLDVRSKVENMVIACAADSALLHNTDASATPLELEHALLIRSLAHQALRIFQLRPLETGQSKDVSGSIRASRGGAWDDSGDTAALDEAEWLFHQRSDGSVHVWGRGET